MSCGARNHIKEVREQEHYNITIFIFPHWQEICPEVKRKKNEWEQVKFSRQLTFAAMCLGYKVCPWLLSETMFSYYWEKKNLK